MINRKIILRWLKVPEWQDFSIFKIGQPRMNTNKHELGRQAK